jgi:hypothetical protein
VHPVLYKLFIYSIIWRTSISNLVEFSKFKLSENAEEELRIFLNQNLSTKKSELFNNLDRVISIPSYHNCLIKPKVKSDLSRGIFSAYNMSEVSHLLLLVNFGLFFYTEDNSVGEVHKRFSNKQNQKVIIALADIIPWRELNKLVVSQMLNKK